MDISTLLPDSSALRLDNVTVVEGGGRLADRLGIPVSADTLLRIARRTVRVPIEPPRVIGVEALQRTADAMMHEVQEAALEVTFAQVPDPRDRNIAPYTSATARTDRRVAPARTQPRTLASGASRR